MLNKLIIAFLAITLVAVPAAASAAVKITASASIDTPVKDAMHGDFSANSPAGHVPGTDGTEKCHQVEESGCCKDECGCCVTQFFPMSATVLRAISFSQPINLLEPVDLLDADADRLIRPPRYI